jgi:hypothetical protein
MKEKKLPSITALTVVVAAVLALAFSACSNGSTKSGDPQSSSDGFFSVSMPASTPNGTLQTSHTTARKNTQITITAIPDPGYKTNWVKYNGTTITRSGSQYKFPMPERNVEITAEFVAGEGGTSYDIYSSGGLNTGGTWVLETNGDPGSALIGTVEVAQTEGITGGTTRAIKIDLTKIEDYFALRIPLDGMDINFQDIDALTLWAKAGAKTSSWIRYPAINRVAFGDYTSNEWVKSVWYCGEAVPETRYIPLTANWKEITVPVPARIDHQINTITLFFTADQVEGQVIYIDQISFDEAESRELVQIVLPSTGSIPYKTNTGSQLASDLERLTRAARFVYSVDGSRYTLYGEDPADGADAFLNRMSDFYTDITYSVGDNPVSGKTYTPDSAGGSFNLSVSYGGKSSLANTMPNGNVVASRMNVSVKGLPATATDGALMIDDFDNVPTQNNGGKIHVQLPYYWGGTAGDSQSYGDKVLYCWVDNIMQNPMPLLDTGIPLDTWFVTGHMDLNHDLSGTSKIVISAKLSTGVKYTFSLSSGYTGAALTLKPDGKKYTKQATMVGLGFEAFKEYVFDLADFTGDADFDPKNVTAYEFFTDAALNAGNDAAFTVADPCFLQVQSIKAGN